MSLNITDPYAYYRFENDDLDSSGNSRNGTPSGSPTFVTGKFGIARDFVAASSQRIDINGSVVAGGNAYSVSLWFKTTSTAEGTLWSNGKTGSDNAYSRLSINGGAAGKLYWEFRDDGGATLGSILTASLSLNDGAWHNVIAIRRANASWELFVDGTSRGTSSQALSTVTVDQGAIGALVRTSPAIYLTASVDEVNIFNRVVTAGEITTLSTIENFIAPPFVSLALFFGHM